MSVPRSLQAALGAALVVVGLLGVGSVVALSTAADGAPADAHQRMHDMMDAMHGEGTGERMHDVEGGDEMMDECGSMMHGGLMGAGWDR